MVRLQIQLERAQHSAVKRRARKLGVSVAEVIRRCVAADLQAEAAREPEDRARRALAAAGRYTDPASSGDVALEHDAALAAAYRR